MDVTGWLRHMEQNATERTSLSKIGGEGWTVLPVVAGELPSARRNPHGFMLAVFVRTPKP